MVREKACSLRLADPKRALAVLDSGMLFLSRAGENAAVRNAAILPCIVKKIAMSAKWFRLEQSPSFTSSLVAF